MSENGSAPTKVGRYFAHGNPYGFQKGQSGNPGGRSKKLAEIADLARDLAPDAIRALHEIVVHGKSDRVRVAAAEALLDRALGRPGPQLPEADRRPRITKIETVIIDPKRDRDATLCGELEGARMRICSACRPCARSPARMRRTGTTGRASSRGKSRFERGLNFRSAPPREGRLEQARPDAPAAFSSSRLRSCQVI